MNFFLYVIRKHFYGLSQNRFIYFEKFSNEGNLFILFNVGAQNVRGQRLRQQLALPKFNKDFHE